MKLWEIYSKIKEDNSDDIDLSMIKRYKKEIDEYAESNIKIYRGMKATSNVVLLDGSNMNRKAANTTNYTNILTSVLPSWANWPKRNKSFICTMNHSYASGYGTVYYAIPLENQIIAQSDKSDFWDALPTNKRVAYSVSGFNAVLEEIVEKFTGEEMDPFDPNNIIEKLEETRLKIKEDGENIVDYYKNRSRDFHVEFIRVLRRSSSALEFLNTMLDPSIENHLLKNYHELQPYNTEVWMSGKVLFIEKTWANKNEII